MKIRTSRALLASMLSLGVAAALVGVSAPAANAAAFVPGNIDSAATATSTTITLDLTNVHYAAPPTNGIYITVLRNNAQNNLDCATEPAPRGAYCWSESLQSTDQPTNVNGVFTFKNLTPNTWYEVEVYPYEPNASTADTMDAIIKTGPGLPGAPDAAPSFKQSRDGFTGTLKANPIHTSAIGDTTPKSKLKYNVYARYSGAWHKVLSKVSADGKYHAVKLPKYKTITFAETVINSLGESAKDNLGSSQYKLQAAAPTLGKFSGKIAPTFAPQKWTAARANAGHITKYVLTVKRGDTTVYKHTYKASARSGTATGLHGGITYNFTLTAYNSYGKHASSATLYGNSTGTL